MSQKENEKAKKLPLSLKISVLQIVFYIAFTLKGFIDDFGDSKYLPFILILEGLFLVSFIVTLIVAIKNRDKKELKGAVKEHKGAVKDVKLTIRIVNTITQVISVALAFVIIMDTFTVGDASLFKQIFAILAALSSLFSAVKAVVKTSIKVIKRIRKGKKGKEKEEKAAIKQKEKEEKRNSKKSA